MKATLITLLTLGSLAMAETPLTLVANYNDGTGSEGNSECIVFTLTGSADRYAPFGTTAALPQSGAVELTSIEIASRGNDSLDNYQAVITDAAGLVVGLAGDWTTTKTKHGKGDWGWDFTRYFTTYTGFTPFMGGWDETLTLNIGDEYRIYFANEDQAGGIVERGMMGDPVTIQTGDFSKVGFTNSGGFDASGDRILGFGNGAAGTTNMTKYVPLMAITVSYSEVPEPTTGTLSLLALAGLCIRRRK